MRRRVHLIIALLFCCSFALVACDESQVQKVKRASARIDRVVGSAIELLPAFQQEGLFDEGEQAKIAEGLNAVKVAIREFNVRAQSYKTFDATAKADLAKAFIDVTGALATLNEQGVLHIKNPKVKGRVQIALAATSLAAQEIADALDQEQ
jgi:hypothetical protein